MSWSHSRTRRFPEIKRTENSEYLTLPSMLSQRSTGIGFGQRSQPHNAYGMESPPPGTYNLPFVSNTRGTKFSKATTMNDRTRYITPGPGTYESGRPFEKYSPKITLKSRIKINLKCESPPPGTYSPEFKLTHYTGFQNISFGIGERSRIKNSSFDAPGPGTYEIASKFDKLSKKLST